MAELGIGPARVSSHDLEGRCPGFMWIQGVKNGMFIGI